MLYTFFSHRTYFYYFVSFCSAEKLSPNITGFEIFGEMHAIAYMVVTAEKMIQVRDALKPHRGEVY